MRKSCKVSWLRVLAVLLIVCIIFKLLPVIPQNWDIIKAAVPAGKNINLGTDGINTSDTVYYASNSGTSYGWRVVSKDESSMTLFSNAEIGEKKVYDISHPDGTYLGTHQNWSDSDICNYLNGTFLDTYFTDIEKSDAAISSYSNHVEYGYNLTDTFIPNQKIVLPSVEEVKVGGLWGLEPSALATGSWWWLRTPGINKDGAADVGNSGEPWPLGYSVFIPLDVRPVFNLNRASVIFSSASGENKSTTFSATSDGNNVSSWTLTLADGTGFAANRKSGEVGKVAPGEQITVDITDLASGNTNAYTQISAMLIDSNGDVISYGRIKDVVETGEVAILIPSTVLGGNYILKVFAEDVNSSASSNLTDYASNTADIPISIVSNDATLLSLMVNGATLNPTFEKNTTLYTANVANEVGTVSVTPIVNDPNAIVKVNNKTVISGNASADIDLMEGNNTIDVVVIAEDGITTNEFTIMVARASKVLYTVDVDGGTGSASYAAGETVTIIADTPGIGKQFKEWRVMSGGIILTDKSSTTTTFPMPASNVEISAIYEDIPTSTYMIDIQTDGNGAASANVSEAPAGANIILNVVPSSGYRFREWKAVSGVVSVSGSSFTMPSSNVILKAIFEKIMIPDVPTTGDPTTGDPTTGGPTTEDPTIEDPTIEDPTTGESTTGESTTEDPTTGESTTEDPTTEDPTTGESTTEDPTMEDPTTGESTTEDPTMEDPTKGDSTTGSLTSIDPAEYKIKNANRQNNELPKEDKNKKKDASKTTSNRNHDVPETGDEIPIVWRLAVALATCIVIIVLKKMKRKSRINKKKSVR